MTTPNLKPTVLFVHGAWHTNEAFGAVQTLLSKAGYGIKNLQLASSTPNGPYDADIADDIAVIQNALTDILSTNRDSEIIVVMHSYGGIPGSAAAKGFWRKQREEEGKKGGIVHLVYLASLALPEGVSLKMASGGEPSPWTTVHDDTYITATTQAREIFYSNLPDAEAAHWISKLQRQSLKTFVAPAGWAAWKHIPSTYVVCGQDRAIPVLAQEGIISQEGAKFEVVRFEDANHSPFLSMPKETADVIRRAAGEKV